MQDFEYRPPAGGASPTRATVDWEGAVLSSAVRRSFRDDFPGTSVAATKWTVTPGTGMTVSVASSVLTVVAGTTINSETIIKSVETFTIPFRVQIMSSITARDANRQVYFEVVSEDGLDSAQLLWDGTVATTMKYDTTNGGTAVGASSNSSWLTSASNAIQEIDLFHDEARFGVRNANSVGTYQAQATRSQRIPDANKRYYIQIRVKNLSTAPAAATLSVDHVAALDINEIPVEVTAGRGAGLAATGMSIPTMVVNSGAIAVYEVPGIYGGATSNHLISGGTSAASTNATSVKTSQGCVQSISLTNASASWRYFKLYNKASAPTVGTDTPAAVIGMPPNSSNTHISVSGINLTLGIAYAITAGMANTDTTAIAAGDCSVSINYM